MRHPTGRYILVLLLAVLFAGVLEAKSPPTSLDQEEYLDAEDWFRSGLALNSAGNYREAAKAFARSIAIDPENPLAWLNLGTAQALGGDDGAAVAALKKAVLLDPKLAMGFANLGEIYFRTRQFEEAVWAYSAELSLWPGDGNAHYKLGLAYLFLKDAGKAQAEYLHLKALDPELAGKLFQAINLGVVN